VPYVSSELTRRLSALVGPLQVSEVGYSREREQEVGGVQNCNQTTGARTPVGLFNNKNNKKLLKLPHVRWVRAVRVLNDGTSACYFQRTKVPESILCIIAVGFCHV
jgi:hypothetical protein